MFERILKAHKYRDYAPTDNFSIKELREFCDILNEYCKENIGYKKRKGLPTFSVMKSKSDACYGQYCPEKNKIYVYRNNTPNLRQFVKTFIHEYTHSTQNLRHYANRLVKYGYEEHPDEIEARQTEFIHYKAALKYLRSNL